MALYSPGLGCSQTCTCSQLLYATVAPVTCRPEPILVCKTCKHTSGHIEHESLFAPSHLLCLYNLTNNLCIAAQPDGSKFGVAVQLSITIYVLLRKLSSTMYALLCKLQPADCNHPLLNAVLEATASPHWQASAAASNQHSLSPKKEVSAAAAAAATTCNSSMLLCS